MTDRLRVAVVEDHPLVRQGLETLVGGSGEYELVAGAGSLEELGVPADRPDVVVLDLNLPGCSGAAAVAHLVAGGASVVVFSASGEEGDVLDALAAGASGYLTKAAEPEEILRAVGVAGRGGSYVSPTLAALLLKADRAAERDDHSLTKREKEILVLVAQGERDQDIANELYISVSTVHSHLERIRAKTGRRRRPDLTRLAIEQGLI